MGCCALWMLHKQLEQVHQHICVYILCPTPHAWKNFDVIFEQPTVARQIKDNTPKIVSSLLWMLAIFQASSQAKLGLTIPMRIGLGQLIKKKFKKHWILSIQNSSFLQ